MGKFIHWSLTILFHRLDPPHTPAYTNLLLSPTRLNEKTANRKNANRLLSPTRLNEKTANRKNANRLFDSQNNNRGGYNTGDRFHTKASGKDTARRQYSMVIYD